MNSRLNASLKPRSAQSGSALILVLMFAGILTLVLGVYLNMTSTETKQAARSLVWNSALPIAEAGIEEAMSHIANNTNDYAVDNWIQQGTNDLYFKERTLGLDKYSVIIAGSPGSPTMIYSTGSVYSAESGKYITRTVEVSAFMMNFQTPGGMIAKSVNFGGALTVDSFDSSDITGTYCNPANDTTGYYDPARAGDIGFIGNPVGPVNLGGSSHIYGFAAAAAGYTVTANGAASIGSRTWASKGIQRTPLDHGTNGFAFNMVDVKIPYQSGTLPTSGTVNGTDYTYVISSGYYMASNMIDLNYGKKMYVAGAAKLYVTGTIDLSQIVFTNGAHLDLYIAQDNVLCSAMVGGSTQLTIWGLSTCTTLILNGNAQFVGIVYAPKTTVKATGGAQFYGAMTANSFTSSGNFFFHHDQAAGKTIPSKPLAIQGWRELTTPGS